MSGKGALHIDKAAHSLMEFYPQGHGATEVEDYTAFYHEERLYSVRDVAKGTITLIYADNPYEAIEKASGYGIKFYAIFDDIGLPLEKDGKTCVWKFEANAIAEKRKMSKALTSWTVRSFIGYSDELKIMD